MVHIFFLSSLIKNDTIEKTIQRYNVSSNKMRIYDSMFVHPQLISKWAHPEAQSKSHSPQHALAGTQHTQ